MAKGRMDLSAFAGKLLEEQDGDTLGEGIRVLAQTLRPAWGRQVAQPIQRTARAESPQPYASLPRRIGRSGPWCSRWHARRASAPRWVADVEDEGEGRAVMAAIRGRLPRRPAGR